MNDHPKKGNPPPPDDIAPAIGAASRAIEQLRLIMAEVQVATVRAQVGLSLLTDFENYTIFKPAPRQEAAVAPMLDQLVAWGSALKPLRQK